MKLFLLLTAAALCQAKPRTGHQVQFGDGKIIGGEEAPEHEFPWQISLRNLGSHICGGSIINKNQIITAAHCVEGQLPLLDSVVAGAHHRILEGGHQKRKIAKMEAHESWNTPDFDHDVGIITVTEPFDFSDPNVQPIEFFTSSNAEIPAETVCNSTGWGLTNGAGFSLPNALQWAKLPVHSREACEEIFPDYITDNMLCAGSAGLATCNGDSGGPLVCPDASGVGKLAGLVSFGYTGCTNAGVFTKVSQFESWILSRWEGEPITTTTPAPTTTTAAPVTTTAAPVTTTAAPVTTTTAPATTTAAPATTGTAPATSTTAAPATTGTAPATSTTAAPATTGTAPATTTVTF